MRRLKFHKVYSETSTASVFPEKDKKGFEKANAAISKEQTFLTVTLITLFLAAWQCIAGHWYDTSVKVFVVIFALGLAGWYTEHKTKNGARLIPTLIRAIPTAVIFVSTAFLLWHLFPAPAFAARMTWTIATAGRPCGVLVEEGRVTPIYSEITLSITNLSPSSIMVESYLIEALNKNGEWKTVSPEFGIKGKLCQYTVADKDFSALHEERLVTLDSQLAYRNLAPNETAQGWVFVTKPVAWPLRLTVTTATGGTYTEPIYWNLPKGWLLQPMGMEITTNIINANNVPVEPTPEP